MRTWIISAATFLPWLATAQTNGLPALKEEVAAEVATRQTGDFLEEMRAKAAEAELGARIDSISLVPGPQGPAGAKGDAGTPGPQGPPGPAGREASAVALG